MTPGQQLIDLGFTTYNGMIKREEDSRVFVEIQYHKQPLAKLYIRDEDFRFMEDNLLSIDDMLSSAEYEIREIDELQFALFRVPVSTL